MAKTKCTKCNRFVGARDMKGHQMEHFQEALDTLRRKRAATLLIQLHSKTTPFIRLPIATPFSSTQPAQSRNELSDNVHGSTINGGGVTALTNISHQNSHCGCFYALYVRKLTIQLDYADDDIDFSNDDTWNGNVAGDEAQLPSYQDVSIEPDTEIEGAEYQMAAEITSNSQTLVAAEQQANNVFNSLKTFKATITTPLEYDIGVPPVDNLSNNERHSIDFHTLMSTEKVARQAQRNILDFVNSLLVESNAENLPLLSLYRTTSIFETIYLPMQIRESHMCPRGCHMYYDGDRREKCPNCEHPRLDDNRKPFATIKQLSLAEQLANLVTSQKFRDCIRQYKERRDTVYHQNRSGLSDYYDGTKYQQSTGPSKDLHNINLAMYTDGFQPFTRGGISMTIVMFVILNLPPDIRYRKDIILIPMIIPGPKEPRNIHSFLHYVHKDLLVLEKMGKMVSYDGQTYRYTATIELAIGDIPASAHMCGHAGHTHYHGCRICRIRATSASSNRRYFPQPLHHIMNKTREDFENPDQALGLRTRTPLILYDSFDSPFFMGLDEMHFWGANLGPKIWNVINNSENLALDSENPLFLKKRYRELISRAALNCQKSIHSGAMDGAFTDMESKPGTMRSVDWIDFIVHLLPTTVVEAIQLQKHELREEEAAARRSGNRKLNRKTDEELLAFDQNADAACRAIVVISRACSFSQQYTLSPEDVMELQRLFTEWLEYVNTNIHSPFMLTINHHYANHMAEAINILGPLRIISARVMERSIGLIKHDIRSRQNPAANAFNYVKDHFISTRRNMDKSLEPDRMTTYGTTQTQVLNRSWIDVIGMSSVTKIVSMFPSKSGQRVSIIQHSVNHVIFESTGDDNIHERLMGQSNLKYGALQLLYTDGLDEYALVNTIYPVYFGHFGGCHLLHTSMHPRLHSLSPQATFAV